jgi:DNA-binding response OmpR family regulator
MVATIERRKSGPKSAANAMRHLPPRMRILYITIRDRTGAWLTEALASDRTVHVDLDLAIGATAGMKRLRDEVYDAVLVCHLPGELDALQLVEGYRAGGAEEPIIILGAQTEQEMAGVCYEAGADAYLCVHTATTRNLMWVLARAIQRHQLLRENHLLSLAEQSRLQREHDEAERLLKEQRTIIDDLHALNSGQPNAALDPALPAEIYTHCRELLRTYVIMGSGNLSDELEQLAELMVAAGLTARQTMQLHLTVLEELLTGLGARSARHVMTRADLLALEIMIHLADGYQRRYRERISPPEQLLLPGFC